MHLYQKLMEIVGSINYLLMRGPVPGLFIGVLRVPNLSSLRQNFMKAFALFTARGQRKIGLQNCFLEVFPYVPFW